MNVTEPRTRRLAGPDGSVEYDVTGEGPLVVCLPGMGELRGSYRFTAPVLAAHGFRVATMDLRGHGGSDATFTRYDDVAAAEDALAIIGELGGPAVIVGNSMGAGAAVWAAAERPADVAGVALLGPFVRDPRTNPLVAAALKLALSGPWAPRVWTAYLPTLYPGRRPADFDEHVAAIRESMRRPGHARAFTSTTRTSHAPAQERLSQVRAPALVIMGDSDPDFDDPAGEARWITEQLDARLLLVPSAGHYPQVEFPEQVNPVLSEFCAQAHGRG